MITTASAAVFIALVIAEFAGLFENPYSGLVVFIAVPALFVVGLLLIPLGMRLEQRRLLRDPSVAGWPVFDFNQPVVRWRALMLVALTAVNIVIILLAGYGSLHWMDSPQFCGQVCHTAMQPQFVAWRDGPHSRIACAHCHIGSGAPGFVKAKLAGTRQLVHVITGRVPTPVPPGAHMAPGAQAQTCLDCHQPSSRGGTDRMRVIREYADDEANTETVTVLQMYMGGPTSGGHSIHWHADPANRIEYVATGADRQTIIYIKATDAKGQVKEYRAAGVTDQAISSGVHRTMDCVDCHNTVGHPISPTAERMVDRAIAAGSVSAKLPFARREGVRLVTASYSSQDEAANAIDRGVRDFYAKQAGADQQAVGRAAAALQDVYRRNVFPSMKVTWGSYPENSVHIASPGCVRCHDDEHKTKEGSAINGDCEYCHKQIEMPPAGQ